MIELEEATTEASAKLRDEEYWRKVYAHRLKLIKKAKLEGLPASEAEIRSCKVVDWTLREYARAGDPLGNPRPRMDRAMNEELKRYRKSRRGRVVLPVAELEEEEEKAIRRQVGRKGPLPSLGQIEKEKGTAA